jgi:hypothetical protein
MYYGAVGRYLRAHTAPGTRGYRGRGLGAIAAVPSSDNSSRSRSRSNRSSESGRARGIIELAS